MSVPGKRLGIQRTWAVDPRPAVTQEHTRTMWHSSFPGPALRLILRFWADRWNLLKVISQEAMLLAQEEYSSAKAFLRAVGGEEARQCHPPRKGACEKLTSGLLMTLGQGPQRAWAKPPGSEQVLSREKETGCHLLCLPTEGQD